MGSACCVAARDRTITNGTSSDVIPRNVRYSPSWSVRWDNRRRVAGEEASMTWYSDANGTNDRLDNKSQTTVATAYTSEENSPLESFRNLTWRKSSPHVPPPSQNPTIKSPNLSISEEGGSPFVESNHGSHGGSSDWSIPTFNNNNNENEESFDSESFNFKTTRSSNSPSIDMRTCGVCAKLLTEKSSWGGQKIIANNELAVVAILICGHVYHAECLENMTSEINKYDPVCPVCTFGEKQTVRMSEKALKAEMEMRARVSKRSRSRVVDGEMNDVVFDHRKSRSYKMSSSSSMKGKAPFLKRHFSFGSKGSRSMSGDGFSRRKGFFWAKSNKE